MMRWTVTGGLLLSYLTLAGMAMRGSAGLWGRAGGFASCVVVAVAMVWVNVMLEIGLSDFSSRSALARAAINAAAGRPVIGWDDHVRRELRYGPEASRPENTPARVPLLLSWLARLLLVLAPTYATLRVLLGSPTYLTLVVSAGVAVLLVDPAVAYYQATEAGLMTRHGRDLEQVRLAWKQPTPPSADTES